MNENEKLNWNLVDPLFQLGDISHAVIIILITYKTIIICISYLWEMLVKEKPNNEYVGDFIVLQVS